MLVLTKNLRGFVDTMQGFVYAVKDFLSDHKWG